MQTHWLDCGRQGSSTGWRSSVCHSLGQNPEPQAALSRFSVRLSESFRDEEQLHSPYFIQRTGFFSSGFRTSFSFAASLNAHSVLPEPSLVDALSEVPLGLGLWRAVSPRFLLDHLCHAAGLPVLPTHRRSQRLDRRRVKTFQCFSFFRLTESIFVFKYAFVLVENSWVLTVYFSTVALVALLC